MHLLQHEADKFAIYRDLAPFRPLPELDCIAVFDPDMISAIFRSDRFHVVDYAQSYRDIAARTGIDLSGVVAALDHIPLAKEHAPHRRLREEMAGVFGAKSGKIEALLRPAVAQRIDSVFRPGARIDLVADLCVPVYQALFSALLGIDQAAVERGGDISQVFDRMMSLNRRKKLDAALRATLARFEAAKDDLATYPELARALTILGKDPLVGSLSLSLWHEIETNPGLPFDRIAYPRAMAATGVPYIERIATGAVRVGALDVEKGQRVRLYLDATTRQALGEDAGLSFGKGRHLCLGKPLALLTWKVVTESLAACPLRPILGAREMRKGDYVFSYPDSAWIELAA